MQFDKLCRFLTISKQSQPFVAIARSSIENNQA